MTAYNAMLNIASMQEYSNDETDTDTETDTETDTDTSSDDDYVDYEVISETVDKDQPYMQTSSTYDSTGNYAISETNASGNTVTYTYDVNGNITSVTDGEENVVNYTYNTSGNLSSVSSGEAENKYYYNSTGNIMAIDHNNFRYQFNYDVFDRLVSTKIGNVAVASNTYSQYSHNLTKTTFAKMLIDGGVDINYADYEDYTPLMRAVDFGDLEIIKLLVNNGADIYYINEDGDSAVSIAENEVSKNVYDYFNSL